MNSVVSLSTVSIEVLSALSTAWNEISDSKLKLFGVKPLMSLSSHWS